MSEFNVRPGSLGASPAPTMRGPARARDRSTIPVLPELIPTTLLWGGVRNGFIHTYPTLMDFRSGSWMCCRLPNRIFGAAHGCVAAFQIGLWAARVCMDLSRERVACVGGVKVYA
ncbi:unnamed protein product [Pylaiella littoralis]